MWQGVARGRWSNLVLQTRYLENMKTLFFAICIVSMVGCTSAPANRVSLGSEVFGVVARECRGSDTQKAFCESIQLVELVQGVFYKVQPAETAFVVWHGPRWFKTPVT